ncbi:Tyrosine recombinase xerC [Rhizobium favelukesii]|uniref:Tyrosine recombinase xerC n=1 Tax=Rhizobium favelukesii TaxID=348824 RepID=W6R7G7_9HYPH|nr:Tyrosine recombinase xerC [Rhizobium favelukesii]
MSIPRRRERQISRCRFCLGCYLTPLIPWVRSLRTRAKVSNTCTVNPGRKSFGQPTTSPSLRPEASVDVALAVDLAAHTGLRAGDLVRLAWSHVGQDAIVISTGKSKHRKEAVIPRYDALNELLDRIPKRSPIILTNSRKRPWTQDGLASSFWTAKVEARMQERDLHFHDLRGTAATNFYTAGLSIRVIAEIMGWEEDQVEKIIRRYVSRGAATREAIRQLNEAREQKKIESKSTNDEQAL